MAFRGRTADLQSNGTPPGGALGPIGRRPLERLAERGGNRGLAIAHLTTSSLKVPFSSILPENKENCQSTVTH